MAQVNEVKYPAYKRLPNLLTNALNSILITSTLRRVFQRIVQVVRLLRSTVAFALKIWLFGGKRSFLYATGQNWLHSWGEEWGPLKVLCVFCSLQDKEINVEIDTLYCLIGESLLRFKSI